MPFKQSAFLKKPILAPQPKRQPQNALSASMEVAIPGQGLHAMNNAALHPAQKDRQRAYSDGSEPCQAQSDGVRMHSPFTSRHAAGSQSLMKTTAWLPFHLLPIAQILHRTLRPAKNHTKQVDIICCGRLLKKSPCQDEPHQGMPQQARMRGKFG